MCLKNRDILSEMPDYPISSLCKNVVNSHKLSYDCHEVIKLQRTSVINAVHQTETLLYNL